MISSHQLTEIRDEYLKRVIAIEGKHIRKYGRRKMTLKELDKIC